MEDHIGFLTYPREEARKQFARARVRHWHEYERIMPDDQASCQAKRCMDCGTPDCHRFCPVHNLIPEWNELVSDEDWRTAWEQLDSTNNFPEFTGRLCSAPCEDACTLRLLNSPVTIRSIELAVIERALAGRVGATTTQQAVLVQAGGCYRVRPGGPGLCAAACACRLPGDGL